MKKKVLFICANNCARSQMAEAWLNRFCNQCFEAQSAGLEPGTIDPLVVQAMAEEGIDVSHKKTQRVFDLWKSGQRFDYIISLCSDAEAQRCPIFPGDVRKLQWPFPDPSQLIGSAENKVQAVRRIRDQIAERIGDWSAQVRPQRVVEYIEEA